MGDVIDLDKVRVGKIDQISVDVLDNALDTSRRSFDLVLLLCTVRGKQHLVMAEVDWGDEVALNDLIDMAQELSPLMKLGQHLDVVHIKDVDLNQFQWSRSNLVYHHTGTVPPEKS